MYMYTYYTCMVMAHVHVHVCYFTSFFLLGVFPLTCQLQAQLPPGGGKVLAMATPAGVELHQPPCPARCYGTGDLVLMETDRTHRGVIVQAAGGRGWGCGYR